MPCLATVAYRAGSFLEACFLEACFLEACFLEASATRWITVITE
jgi:hypothetical protein